MAFQDPRPNSKPQLSSSVAPRREEEATASKSGLLSRLGLLGSGALFLFGKAKWLLAGLKLTKLASVGSMLASSVAYGFVFGQQFGVGMVAMILVHESSHALAMRYYGLPFGPMIFVPFFGAFIEAKGLPPSSFPEGVIAIAGPIGGGAAALLTSAAGVLTGSQFLLALADFGLMVNLFNLLPIGSMDGGRVAGILSKWLLLAGWCSGAALLLSGLVGSPLFYLLMLAGTWTTASRFWNAGSQQAYYNITANQKARLAALYLATTAALLAAMQWNKQHLQSPRQLAHSSGTASDMPQGLLGWVEMDQSHEDEGDDDSGVWQD